MIERAREDPRCVAAALLGSGARQTEDEWSDIDLALRLAHDADLDETMDDWTEWFGSEVTISDRLDVHAWGAVYRVFFCDLPLQIDLSLWPWERFRSVRGEPMRVMFGDSLEPDDAPRPDWTQLARMGWLHALHARSAIHRGRVLQADLMLSIWRDQITSLVALRHGRNPSQARDAHLLPAEVQEAIGGARPSDLERDELLRSLARTADLYLAEVREHDPEYADRLRGAIDKLAQ